MIVSLDIIPIAGRPYRNPGTDEKRVVLATREGSTGIRWWPIDVQNAITNWGPEGIMRLEGVATYKSSRCQVIAWYAVDSIDEILGTMQIHLPEPEEP